MYIMTMHCCTSASNTVDSISQTVCGCVRACLRAYFEYSRLQNTDNMYNAVSIHPSLEETYYGTVMSVRMSVRGFLFLFSFQAETCCVASCWVTLDRVTILTHFDFRKSWVRVALVTRNWREHRWWSRVFRIWPYIKRHSRRWHGCFVSV